MRFAVISDIHSNLEALTAVLNDIDKRQVDEIICLGDVVGYGPNPNECIELIRSNCSLCIKGNHDAAISDRVVMEYFNVYAQVAVQFTRDVLDSDNMAYLASLPLIGGKDQETFVHASPYDPDQWYYITTEYHAIFAFASFQGARCYVGHSHIPKIFEAVENKRIREVSNNEVIFSEGHRHLINVGSVGQPRDGDSRSAYGIVDLERNDYQLIRVDYDYRKTQERMKMNSLPEYLINRLALGN
ncbi:metallophosphoesterase family protein [candidate division KSB1 bacterium]|nr:metallophosphoesterase family protein [candidate division KSB1 bacterium]